MLIGLGKRKSLISLRVRKNGTKQRFTTRLVLRDKEMGSPIPSIEKRLKQKYPNVDLVIERDHFLKRSEAVYLIMMGYR